MRHSSGHRPKKLKRKDGSRVERPSGDAPDEAWRPSRPAAAVPSRSFLAALEAQRAAAASQTSAPPGASTVHTPATTVAPLVAAKDRWTLRSENLCASILRRPALGPAPRLEAQHTIQKLKAATWERKSGSFDSDPVYSLVSASNDDVRALSSGEWLYVWDDQQGSYSTHTDDYAYRQGSMLVSRVDFSDGTDATNTLQLGVSDSHSYPDQEPSVLTLLFVQCYLHDQKFDTDEFDGGVSLNMHIRSVRWLRQPRSPRLDVEVTGKSPRFLLCGTGTAGGLKGHEASISRLRWVQDQPKLECIYTLKSGGEVTVGCDILEYERFDVHVGQSVITAGDEHDDDDAARPMRDDSDDDDDGDEASFVTARSDRTGGVRLPAVLLGRRNGQLDLWDTRMATATKLGRMPTAIADIQPVAGYRGQAWLVADIDSHATINDGRMWGRPLAGLIRYSNKPSRRALSVSGSGELATTACGDGVVRAWDTATGKIRWESEPGLGTAGESHAGAAGGSGPHVAGKTGRPFLSAAWHAAGCGEELWATTEGHVLARTKAND